MINLLEQAYGKVRTDHQHDLTMPIGFRQMLIDDVAFETYKKELSEGLEADTKKVFSEMVDNTRVAILESNNMMQFNPYETLHIPLLRKFFPRLIAKQLVHLIPMDQPDIVRYFITGKFKKYGQSTYPANQTFPSTTVDISRGPSYGVSATATSARGANPGATVNILTLMGLDTSNAHIEKDFVINGVADSTGSTSVTIRPDVDGNFSEAVTTLGSLADTISGNIDFETGIFSWSSTTGNVVSVTYQAYASLEENQLNPTIRFELEKVRITSVLRQIQGEWTLPFQQDTKNLFNIDIQTQIVNMIGEQIALDIDREIITALFNENSSRNPSTHSDTFDLTPPTTYDGNQVDHFRDIIYKLNTLSAQVYDTSQMGAANIIACNPLTAAVLESINSFKYLGDSVSGGDLGYQQATLGGGKWRVLVSSIVPDNKLLLVYRSNDPQRAVYAYCPYIPAMLHPYPFGSVPTVTVMSRYGTKSLRPEGIAVLTTTTS